MKIVNKSETTKFRDLKPGDVFKMNNNYYMKIKYELDANYDQLNTVSLNTNSLLCVRQDSEVIPVDCELIIK